MARTITSSHNQKLKEIRKLRVRRHERDRAGRFVAEGEDLLAAADGAGWAPLERFCAAGSGLLGVEVEPELLASASGLASGTRALAVYQERWAPRPLGPLCVYVHGVQDPGNAGAVLRSAAAFGAGSVVFGPGSADPFGPKAVRASMGAVFTVPVARARTLDELPGLTIALVASAGAPLTALGELWRSTSEGSRPDAKVPLELTLLIGSERDGLPPDIVQAADETVHIPIRTHSLNAAMAATVALYEVTRMAGP
ncbi:MAG: RNA methyltransferase [Actinomycetota bacterium]|nr:RNA methyltransferase [Actinomycetota bacterium]